MHGCKKIDVLFLVSEKETLLCKTLMFNTHVG